VPVHLGDANAYLGFLRVEYTDGEGEDYVLPLAFAQGIECERLTAEQPQAVLARVKLQGGGDGVVYDAVYNPRFGSALLDAVASRRRLHGAHGDIMASNTPVFRRLLGDGPAPEPTLLGAEQSNTSIRFGDRLILKLYRRLDEGTSLDLEIGEFLTEQGFEHAPAVAGAMEHNGRTVAIVNEFIVNEGDAWSYALDRITAFFDRVNSSETAAPVTLATTTALLAGAAKGPPPEAQEQLGGGDARRALLGAGGPGLRAGALHAVLPALALPVHAQPGGPGLAGIGPRATAGA
jgi:trehalose synthase-fused probable maltokinase